MSSQIETSIEQHITKLKRKQVHGAFDVARSTIKLLREVVGQSRCRDAEELIKYVSSIGKRLIAASPGEVAVGNMVKRVLHIIRDDHATLAAENRESSEPARGLLSLHTPARIIVPPVRQAQDDTPRLEKRIPSLLNLKDSLEGCAQGITLPGSTNTVDLKKRVLESLKDLMDEFPSSYKHIAEQALDHIHANEIILTFGKSKSVEEFFRFASKHRQFSAIVVDTAPELEGQQMAQALAALNINTTLISDAAAFAMMSRVNKVIIGTHAILANGGLLLQAGASAFALAARAHGVPMVVLAPTYKLCPLFPQDPSNEIHNVMDSPTKVLDFASDLVDHADVRTPVFDYVQPEFVSFYIMDDGQAHHPTYINRMLAEYYTPDDYFLQ